MSRYWLLCVIALGACVPITSVQPTPTAQIELASCLVAPDTLCFVQFIKSGPEALTVQLSVPDGVLQDLGLKVIAGDKVVDYPCAVVSASPTVVDCTGPAQPFNSILRLNVYTLSGKVLLASGKFELKALALPTLPVATAPSEPTLEPTATP